MFCAVVREDSGTSSWYNRCQPVEILGIFTRYAFLPRAVVQEDLSETKSTWKVNMVQYYSDLQQFPSVLTYKLSEHRRKL